MSVKGPELTSPMEALRHVYEKHKEKNETDPSKAITLVARNDQRPRRLFSDVLKELDKSAHDSQFFMGYGKRAFEELLLKHKLPVTDELNGATTELFSDLDNSFTSDPGWNTFWLKVKNEENLNDEQIEHLKNQTLIAYRFKLMSNAMFSIQTNQNFTTEEKNQAKKILSVLQIYNGKYNDNKANVGQATKNDYEKKSATVYAQDINTAVAQAIAMLKEGKPSNEVEEFIEKKRVQIFQANKGNDNYAVNYGDEGARQVFDEYFSVDKLLQKAREYAKASNDIGFDIQERYAALDKFRQNHQDHLGNDNKNAVVDFAILVKNMGFFTEQRLESNSQITQKPNMEVYLKASQELNTRLEGSLLDAVAKGNMDLVKDFANVGITTDKKTNNYKRSILNAFKDGFKDFPKSLKDLFIKPSRSVTEIAEISGRKDIVESIQNAVIERKESVSKEKTKQDNVLLSELESTMRVQPQSTPKSTVQPTVPMVGVSGNPLLITPLLKQRQKPPLDPAVSKYLENINALLKEVEKAAKEVDQSDIQEVRLIEVEKIALRSAKAIIEKSDISSPEGRETLDRKLQAVSSRAKESSVKINGHDMGVDTELSGKRELLLLDIRHDMLPEVSQSQKRGPTSNQRG